jgi:trigger factor
MPLAPKLRNKATIDNGRDAFSVKLSVERQPASLVVLDITADEVEFAEAMTKAYRKVAKDIQMPGFRKGKAPRNVIERFYGRDVFLREAADEVMDKLYRRALEQESITPVGEPSVEINDLEPVNFVVTVPVYPVIGVNDYASVRIEPVDAAVDDAEVEGVLDRLRKSQSEWIDPEEDRTPHEGDQVTIDYEVMSGDTPFQAPVTDALFVLGETNLLTQLREKIEEMNVGDRESFDLAFDEDDQTTDPTIRGKSLSYTVNLKGLKQRDLVPLDDEFAKVNETESLEHLRMQIRNDIHIRKTTDGRTGVVNQIIEAMAVQAEIDPPAVMVEDEVEHRINHLKEDLQRSNTPWEGYLRLQAKTEDDLKEELRPEAVRRLRSSLFLQEVAKREAVEVTDEEINGEIDRITGTGNDGDPIVSDQSDRMAKLYQSDYFKNMLRNELFQRKLTERLIEIATDGHGAVLNGYVVPEPESGPDPEIVEVDGAVVHDQGMSAETTDLTADADLSEGYAGAVQGDGANEAPEGYPIKGNAESMLYHTSESGSYASTIAEWYFASEEDAVNAGFQAPANINGGSTSTTAPESPADEVAAEDDER